MKWIPIIDPMNNILFSALIALIPIVFIFWALIIKRMKGYYAGLLALVIALIISISIYKMPVTDALLSAGQGALYGLFPIFWIILTALFLFNITVRSGKFEIIKNYLASITSDRRLQVLLIAF